MWKEIAQKQKSTKNKIAISFQNYSIINAEVKSFIFIFSESIYFDAICCWQVGSVSCHGDYGSRRLMIRSSETGDEQSSQPVHMVWLINTLIDLLIYYTRKKLNMLCF